MSAPPVACVTLSSSTSTRFCSSRYEIKEAPPSIRIFSPNYWRAFVKASLGSKSHTCAAGKLGCACLETTTSGTGVFEYGSLRAVFPPMMMQSTRRRRCRKVALSAADVTSVEDPFIVLEPSAPTTIVATMLTPGPFISESKCQSLSLS